MLKVATKTFNDEYVTLNESDKNELKYFICLYGKSLKGEICNTKDSVIEKLNNNLNESTDTELKEKLQKTINKINESENSLTSLYKLRQLESGLIS
jgi:DNA-binding transcriptional regulator GbsR (MarR family)